MTNKELADLMFPNVKETIYDYEKKYPERDLPAGAIVSRYAPSPTGFVHMGNMLSCFIENKLPEQTNGVFYLRIEDTDQKREIENGVENIINAINILGLNYNEGVISKDVQKGNYGPYIQSERQEIYNVFAKYMIENDIAYPCFCNEKDLDCIRESQQHKKDRIGYYGKYARCRYLTNEERAEKIKAGIPYTIRLKSIGSYDNKICVNDLVKGKLYFPENDQDIVLIKSNGIPVYHFAHVVDDHLMRTTHVLRGEDWVSSLPVHVELFKRFGFKLPEYAHLGLVMLIDENGTKRKISKRKDLNFSISNFAKMGFPKRSLQEYLMTIANTNFEAWRDEHPKEDIKEFNLSFSKIGSSPMFDMAKLVSLSKQVISQMSAHDLYLDSYEWSKEYSESFKTLIEKNPEYYESILNIEREQEKPRKDIAHYSMIEDLIWYMYDDIFESKNKEYEWKNITDMNEIKNILNTYMSKYYGETDDKETWFNKVKDMCDELGYASNIKEYKKNPENYKGNVADISTVLRVALTSKSMTPDLYEIMKLLGKDRIEKRYNNL